MDRRRHDLHAYEYLCHVGEAQQWIEGCLDEELGFGVTELEDGLVDGVVLAKLAQRLQDEGVVRSIYTVSVVVVLYSQMADQIQEGKHRYKQTENINHFLKFIRSVGMPETFIFETTDLYNKRNVPKVIFGIHVLR
jgi:Ras GTPase-activating-like protein IQGAP2/3